VLTARRRGEVAAVSADEVLRDIESRALGDFA
jgi:CPA1 family monovalent cation:H+ antiporter